jgi:hypothetical protein
MEKPFKYIVLTFIGAMVIFIIYTLVWFGKSNLRDAMNNLNRADTTLVSLAKDLKSANLELQDAKKTIHSFDSTLSDIRRKVTDLDRSRLQNQIVFGQMNRKLSVKIDDIAAEMNKVTANLKEPIVH